jgi:glyoxalase family protein
MQRVNGLHHITAISGPAQENLDFYAGVLGMRLVKRSVNQDDPARITCSMPTPKVTRVRT